LNVFDHTLYETNDWLKSLMFEMAWEDRHKKNFDEVTAEAHDLDPEALTWAVFKLVLDKLLKSLFLKAKSSNASSPPSVEWTSSRKRDASKP
jgi:hypothetical protein